MLENSLSNLNLVSIPIPIPGFIISLSLSFCLSYLLGELYKSKSHTLSNPDSLARIFPLLSLATTLVIMVIKSSLALSLGLVGALSIVRFRTPIKEPEELSYIFLCIGLGLATGANQYLAAIIGLLLISLFIYIINFKNKNKSPQTFIRISIKSFKISELNKLIKLISLYCKRIDFHSITFDSNQDIDRTNLSISILPNNFKDIQNISNEISVEYPKSSFTIIDNTFSY